MRKQIVAAVAVGVLALGLAVSTAWASGAISVNIPFSFMVKDKEMPAGQYEIRAEGDQTKLVVKGTGAVVLVPVIERLADTGAKQPKIVFDKILNGTAVLSEVHMPGQDGFLVGVATARESHVVLTGKQ
jgi:hypothetical protein